jgi:hypothetical protein
MVQHTRFLELKMLAAFVFQIIGVQKITSITVTKSSRITSARLVAAVVKSCRENCSMGIPAAFPSARAR